jgi:hypothetical protein
VSRGSCAAVLECANFATDRAGIAKSFVDSVQHGVVASMKEGARMNPNEPKTAPANMDKPET